MAYEYENDPGPQLHVPAGACDTHMHIYEPEYPMAASALIEPPDGKLVDYQKLQKRLGLERTVIVQPSTYGTDNTCTLEAMAKLAGKARGIAVVDTTVTDETLEDLTNKGMRGIRFHMLAGGALPWEILEEMAARVLSFGWHVQLQVAEREFLDHQEMLHRLPGGLVIDHIGRIPEPVTVDNPIFKALLGLVDRGCWVKLSAPYLSSKSGDPRFEDVGKLARKLVQTAPERMLWASNWPHPGINPRPDDALMIDQLLEWADDDATRKRILADNPAELYGF